jgi:hypothetical protein
MDELTCEGEIQPCGACAACTPEIAEDAWREQVAAWVALGRERRARPPGPKLIGHAVGAVVLDLFVSFADEDPNFVPPWRGFRLMPTDLADRPWR